MKKSPSGQAAAAWPWRQSPVAFGAACGGALLLAAALSAGWPSGWPTAAQAGLVGLAAIACERHLAVRSRASRLQEADRAVARLATAIEALPQGFALYDPDDRLVLANARYRDLYAASAPAMVSGARFEDILRYGLERGQYADAVEPEAWLRQRLEAHRQGQDVEQRLGDGRYLAVTERRMADGSTVGIRVDITEIKRAQDALRAGEERFRSMAEAAVEAIVLVDAGNHVRFWSAGAVRMFGWSGAEMLGADVGRIVPERLRAAHEAGLRRYIDTAEPRVVGRTVELAALRRDGTEFPVEVSLSSWRHNAEACFCAIIRDVAERKQAEARVAHLAFYDGLTGLPNRVLLLERLASTVAVAAREGTLAAVLFLDLDRFKEVNDTLGHAAGDRVLRITAERLRASTRESDTVARLGGDEFAILQVGIDSAADIQTLCERLLDAFAAPFPLDEQPVHIGLSVGVAIAPVDGSTPEDLLRFADLALYRAKGDGRGSYRMFESAMDAQLRARKQLESELRLGLERGELELDYQPQVDVASGRVVGAEALVRWRHPERGLLPPGVFIPIAEQSGLIGPLGAWVLRQACREAVSWPDAIGLSVNLSPVQIRRRGLAGEVAAVLEATGLQPERLELEITEGVLLQDDEQALVALEGLRALGVRIALDDFGTGYSSLGYLKRFPFDRLKIDQSFVRDLFVDGDSAAIVRAVIGLGRGLAVGITAEGVENEDQLAFLNAEGCTTAQGFHLGRPMAGGALADRLRDRVGPPRARPRSAGQVAPAPAPGLAEPATRFAADERPAPPSPSDLLRALGLAPGSLWLKRDASLRRRSGKPGDRAEGRSPSKPH